jgi:hypothetical protein
LVCSSSRSRIVLRIGLVLLISYGRLASNRVAYLAGKQLVPFLGPKLGRQHSRFNWPCVFPATLGLGPAYSDIRADKDQKGYSRIHASLQTARPRRCESRTAACEVSSDRKGKNTTALLHRAHRKSQMIPIRRVTEGASVRRIEQTSNFNTQAAWNIFAPSPSACLTKHRRRALRWGGARVNTNPTEPERIRATLLACGYAALDPQAKTLGLSRSTTWVIVASQHKLAFSQSARSRARKSRPAGPRPGAFSNNTHPLNFQVRKPHHSQSIS